jgi:hypothetical protein
VCTNVTHDSTGVFCHMLMDAIKVNPDARPVGLSLIETLMDNDVPQASWGPIFSRLWQQLNNEPGQGRRPSAQSAGCHSNRPSLLPLSRRSSLCVLDP